LEEVRSILGENVKVFLFHLPSILIALTVKGEGAGEGLEEKTKRRGAVREGLSAQKCARRSMNLEEYLRECAFPEEHLARREGAKVKGKLSRGLAIKHNNV